MLHKGEGNWEDRTVGLRHVFWVDEGLALRVDSRAVGGGGLRGMMLSPKKKWMESCAVEIGMGLVLQYIWVMIGYWWINWWYTRFAVSKFCKRDVWNTYGLFKINGTMLWT